MSNYNIRKVEWDEIVNLSEKIYKEIRCKNYAIDTIVPILRGGMTLSLLLEKYMQDVETACIHIRRSKDNKPNSEFGSPIYKGITNEDAIRGKNILITEDIIDQGYSLDFAIEELKKYEPKNIYIATIFNFNKEKYKNVISGENVDNYVWILFPWDGD